MKSRKFRYTGEPMAELPIGYEKRLKTAILRALEKKGQLTPQQVRRCIELMDRR